MSSPVMPKIAPALPRSSGPSAATIQAAQVATPTNSSPSQGSVACHGTEFQDIAVPVLTPPGTTNCEEFPPFEDELPSPPLIQPSTAKDPFVTTPILNAHHAANPAGVPQSQILATIEANTNHTHAANIEPPRADRLGQPVTAHNAQGLFLKEAKLFVANLSNLRTNDQLEFSVGEVFNSFGQCSIIVKRDRNRQPMAFVQYQLVQEAELAMTHANGRLIDGRVIRVERASARQELIISMMTNEPMTEQAVRRALAGHGPIESVKPTGPSAGPGQASTAWLVGFVYYADCRDIIKLMREDETYRVVPAPKVPRQGPYTVAAPRTPQGDLYVDNDSKSIFLGRLPDSVTEEEIRELFAYLGTIVSCNIISKPITTGGMNTFAFVEFKYARDAANAAETTQLLRGEPIRVERKQYAQRRANRLASAAPRFPGPSAPHPQYSQQYAPRPMEAPYHTTTSYHVGHQGFGVPVYNTTPQNPMYMGDYAQYMPPAPRMRYHNSYHGFPQISPNMHYGGTGAPNQGAYNNQHGNFVQMSAGVEEQDGSVFD